MTGKRPSRRGTALLAGLAGATALASAALAVLPSGPVAAQNLGGSVAVPSQGEMLLEADTLVYDNDNNTISAVGGVQIDYDGNRMVAQRVTYDRNTARLVASGGVEILEEDGNRIQAENVDVTDDFREGFVRTLRIETPDETYFAADSAERSDGAVTTFDRGVYTACEPCEERPEKPPVWQVRAQKIIWNGETKIVRFERARFEFLGFPLAFLPAFEIADPTVTQKSGLLTPSIRSSESLGFGVDVPFYLALDPTYDLTLQGTYFSQQGFLGQAEWRQRFNNGSYSVRAAGIRQRNPDEFRSAHVDSDRTMRGMIGTQGEFQINPRWTFGWDVMAQTDRNFSRRYGIAGYNDISRRNEIYLTGREDRNSFDLRAMQFRYQDDGRGSNRDAIQPMVLPSLDYAYIHDDPVAGGQLSLDMNLTSIHRDELDRPNENRVRGIEGSSTRFSTEIEWKRTEITPGGLSLTPILSARADAIGADLSPASMGAIDDFAAENNVAADMRSAYFRSMATAGLEARWPVLFSTTSSTHILEPTAQLFARPDAPYQDTVGIPNEDAQSMVFDATNLFERDKFSGYDRIEGGVRANLGLRYSGSFGNGWSTNAIFGQSFHLAGDNPFAAPDLVYAGAYSGLETRRSDYVGQVGLTTPIGVSLTAGGRFDEEDFAMRRADLTAGYSSSTFSLVGRYTFIEAQQGEDGSDAYGFADDRHEFRLSGSARVAEYWSVFGSGTYDIERGFISRRQVGFRYDDECFDLRFYVSESKGTPAADPERSFGFNIALRTIGEFGGNSNSAFTN